MTTSIAPSHTRRRCIGKTAFNSLLKALLLCLVLFTSFKSFGQTIKTYAGNGTGAFSGDGGAATSASLYSPRGVAVDGAGNLYIGDSFNQRIRKMSLSTVTGIFDEGEISKTLAYPNPAKGYVFISAESEIKQVRLLNAFGALVLTSQPNARQARLDLGTLSAGVYTAVVTAESRIFTRKILVVK